MRSFFIVASLILGGIVYWFFQQEEGPASENMFPGRGGFGGPALVVIKPVQRQQIVDSIEAIGTASANESVTLTAKVTDTVSRVHFEDGDYVEAGRILLELTNTEESAMLAEARANLEDAQTQLRRLMDLGKKNLVPDSDIDEAKAQRDASKARLDAIIARMDDRLVRAPFSGLLGFRQVSPGTLLTATTPITTLDDISVIKLDFSIPEIYLDLIKPGFGIIANSDAYKDRDFHGTVRTVGSRIDPVTRAVSIRALIENKDNLIRPGMLLTLRIVTEQRQALIVAESALTQSGEDTFVYLAGADNRAKKQKIRVGARRFGFVEVVAGLNEGDPVITEGAFKLREGARFRVQGQDNKPKFAGKNGWSGDQTGKSKSSGNYKNVVRSKTGQGD